MKTILDKTTRGELINRINTLHEHSTAQWGEMNIYQMLEHCSLYEEMLLGRKKFKRMFLGRFFGKMALKSLIGNDDPIKRNLPTIPEIKITQSNGDISFGKKKWISQLEEHAHASAAHVEHAFCGKLTVEQIGYLSYKHTDHHLRQFNS